MNWEEIATEDRPVTFVECAIIARFGGSVPKGEHWCWDFPTFDIAWECFHRLNPGKYRHEGLRISLREPPMASVWTVQLCDARGAGMVHSQVFRAFPTPEKLRVNDKDSFFSRVKFTEEFEREFLIQCYMGIQKYREDKPAEKTVHCPFLIKDRKYLEDGCPPLLCIISLQEVK